MKRRILAGGVFVVVVVSIASVALAAGGRPPEGTTYMNDSSLDITAFTQEDADMNDEAKAMDLDYEPACQLTPTPNMTVGDIDIRQSGEFAFRGAPDAGIGTVKFEGKFVSNRKIKATLVERSDASGGCFRKTQTTMTKLGTPS